ncbi:4Fe-4S dicluster domain-containing protein [Butyrivibrio sp. XB500-5]|uniref:4Fe-4S dicluster domain-containing protein n=1 Tax=Butyrivibrio sp. XB500-5 TaxID=2364880 RepID=UPI000EAA7098|nr:4Fe-4S dicluster domain-containing protein [Butyrivibrio sp. XB500-5]RKM61785.1 4Fe-4S dicluster domain-containing protein [Butyrivibrio sp. XB500-5]
MITNDKGLVAFKHKIMVEVCKLAWQGELDEEHKDKLVYELAPGPKPVYRCCVYKEREIVRQRIRLACGQSTSYNEDSKNIVQVIDPACDECPIHAFSVTDNCRFCMGKACINSCKFDAIHPGDVRMHIDSTKCKECGMCANACPYGAIVHLERPCHKACPVGAITYDENGYCKIDESKCIQCGHCIHSCPFGAIGSKTFLVQIIEAIKSGKEVIAMCAPATEGQFGEDISMASVKQALIKLGFADMVEVGLGGDMTAAYESKEWAEAYAEGKKMTTSCCPAFINMLKKHFPEQFENNMSSTVSPMCAISRYLKATRPGCVTVFVGPCIAKKAEAMDESVPDNADYVVTYGELRALMRSKDIDFEPVTDEYQESSIWGKRFATSGGVANAVIECMKERGEDVSNLKLHQVAGGNECKKALLLLKAGKFTDDFIEGMVCPGGCVGGPSKHKTEIEITKARENLLSKADNRKVLENLKKYPMDKFSMHRDGKKIDLPD